MLASLLMSWFDFMQNMKQDICNKTGDSVSRNRVTN
jgi:hypothetical protein